MKINVSLKNRLKKDLIEKLRDPSSREVIVKSAYPMDKADIEKLKSSAHFLEDAKITHVVDASLIGGLVILDGSRIIDMSIKGKLEEIINSLSR